MAELPFISSAKDLQIEFKKNRLKRKTNKVKRVRQYSLSKKEREIIHSKTDGKCHICGDNVLVNKFEADHVKSHSKTGTNTIENFLPAFKTCNNYRWDYLPMELQWILKLGVWTRTEIEKGSKTGLILAEKFTEHEVKREKRRRAPRA